MSSIAPPARHPITPLDQVVLAHLHGTPPKSRGRRAIPPESPLVEIVKSRVARQRGRHVVPIGARS